MPFPVWRSPAALPWVSTRWSAFQRWARRSWHSARRAVSARAPRPVRQFVLRLRSDALAAKGIEEVQWARVVMIHEVTARMRSADYAAMSALEISGKDWANFGFKRYTSVTFPEFDVCGSVEGHGRYDVIILEQVLEHVLYPLRAVRNLFGMIHDNGMVVITTPFLVRIHEYPHDCSRWTELGLRCLLEEGGFPVEGIETGSWGNRECAVANLEDWVLYHPGRHSLRNEKDVPVVVWAIARKSTGMSGSSE